MQRVLNALQRLMLVLVVRCFTAAAIAAEDRFPVVDSATDRPGQIAVRLQSIRLSCMVNS